MRVRATVERAGGGLAGAVEDKVAPEAGARIGRHAAARMANKAEHFEADLMETSLHRVRPMISPNPGNDNSRGKRRFEQAIRSIVVMHESTSARPGLPSPLKERPPAERLLAEPDAG